MAADPEPDLKLEIAHVLTIDVVAYSTLLIHEQSRVMNELNRIVRNAPCSRTAEAACKLTRIPTGDGMALVFFGDPEAPIECAMQISAELKNFPEIALRMGIHSGPINPILDVNDHANVAGAGIDVAQRVMDCGDAGHILVSKRVADDLAPYPRWHRHLHDLGEFSLKHGRKINIFNFYTHSLGNPAVPSRSNSQRLGAEDRTGVRQRLFASRTRTVIVLSIALIAFAAAVTAWWSWANRGSPQSAPPREKSVAVLPFESRSEDKANSYLADSLQDEILTRLSKVADLKVISRTSTQQYRSAPENVRAIAKQLGVTYVVEGSVQKRAETLRVNVQLIEAATDSHVWAESLDYAFTDVLLVETDVAKAIVAHLQAKLTGSEAEAIASQPTSNPEAYRSYLRGKAYAIDTAATPANLTGAQQYLREAVRLDPAFARAWALLSYVDSIGYITFALQPTEALRDESRKAAERALTLEPKLGEAIWAQGYYHYACLRDYDAALQYFEQAGRSLPNSSRVPESLAYVARRRGQWERTESYFAEAERLDPRNPVILTEHALLYFAERQLARAVGKLDEVLDITPADIQVTVLKGAIAQAKGDLQEAATILTPLQPGRTDVGVVETQAYQKILERRAGEIVPKLRSMVAEREPALGYYYGELRFWLGWAQQANGAEAEAAESWREARHDLETFLQQQPDNYALLGDLALTSMALGDKAAAFDFAQRAIAANPIARDAIAGPGALEILARVSALAGERDQAISLLEKLLSIPYAGPLATQNVPLTRALLRLDPMFDSLRDDPLFAKLVAEGTE